jgi:cytochrome b pre-mRNA-processing protein 3
VPDTVDGRFDMIAAVLSLVLIRLEDDPAGATPAAQLAERFVFDMDGQLRELGIGDIVVGKHIGRMMGMLGGRLGAYRKALAKDGELSVPVVRNIYRGTPPEAAALAHVCDALRAEHARLAEMPIDRLVAGNLP